jgi:hypothetical protein
MSPEEAQRLTFLGLSRAPQYGPSELLTQLSIMYLERQLIDPSRPHLASATPRVTEAEIRARLSPSILPSPPPLSEGALREVTSLLGSVTTVAEQKVAALLGYLNALYERRRALPPAHLPLALNQLSWLDQALSPTQMIEVLGVRGLWLLEVGEQWSTLRAQLSSPPLDHSIDERASRRDELIDQEALTQLRAHLSTAPIPIEAEALLISLAFQLSPLTWLGYAEALHPPPKSPRARTLDSYRELHRSLVKIEQILDR